MKIEKYQFGLEQSNSYFVLEDGFAVIIDVPDKRIPAIIEQIGLKPEYIILTHEHVDHLWGLNKLVQKCSCKIIAHEMCSVNIQDSMRNKAREYHIYYALKYKKKLSEGKRPDYRCGNADITFTDKYDLYWRGHLFHMVYAPGHSEGSILTILDDQYLFSGDTVVRDQRTYTAFEGGDEKKLKKITIPYLQTLNTDLIVLPGHSEEFFLREWNH